PQSEQSLDAALLDLARRVAEEHGTPSYLYLQAEAEAGFRRLQAAVKVWGSVRIAYSVKTNPLHALLHDLCSFGASADVASIWEYGLARRAGFPPSRIIVNGPLKCDRDLSELVQRSPAALNVDSLDELRALEDAARSGREPTRVGVRVCPPPEEGVLSRFGLELSTGEVGEAIERIDRNPFLRLACIQVHLGTQVAANRYLQVIDMLARLWTEFGVAPRVALDIGGGFPYDHHESPSAQRFILSRFFGALAATWHGAARPPLIVEPGRIIAAPAMAIVTRVLARKPRTGEPTIVILDSGTNHNVMAAFYEHAWLCPDTGAQESYRFCGPLCMEDDILSGPRYGALLGRGDVVVMRNAGAYSLALSRTFSDGMCHILERREVPDSVYGLKAVGVRTS
ncbi:MAG TPA: hypothetical protein VHS78_11350, partial [Candidatus Elarobacter sp.]|nr:hypothetical protein [Candidatus Elarobacter sp.]